MVTFGLTKREVNINGDILSTFDYECRHFSNISEFKEYQEKYKN